VEVATANFRYHPGTANWHTRQHMHIHECRKVELRSMRAIPWPRLTTASFLLWRLRYGPRAVHVEFVMDTANLGWVCLWALWFVPCQSFPHCSTLIYHQGLVQWANLRPQYRGEEGTNVENHTTFLIHSADAVATNSMFTAARRGQSRGPLSVVSVGLVYTSLVRLSDQVFLVF
jgi:hypothetical protein